MNVPTGFLGWSRNIYLESFRKTSLGIYACKQDVIQRYFPVGLSYSLLCAAPIARRLRGCTRAMSTNWSAARINLSVCLAVCTRCDINHADTRAAVSSSRSHESRRAEREGRYLRETIQNHAFRQINTSSSNHVGYNFMLLNDNDRQSDSVGPRRSYTDVKTTGTAVALKRCADSHRIYQESVAIRASSNTLHLMIGLESEPSK